MHRNELNFIRVNPPHLVEHLAHGNERMCLWVVDVILVDLISDNQDVVFVTKSDNLPQISLIHNLSSRVAGVDNNDSTSIETIFLSLYNFIFELLSIEAPASFLIKVVGKQLTTLQGESS